MSSIDTTELETRLAGLKAQRAASGASEVRFGDRAIRRDVAAQDAEIARLEAQLRRLQAAACRRPIGISF